jgi:hypothetical protein
LLASFSKTKSIRPSIKVVRRVNHFFLPSLAGWLGATHACTVDPESQSIQHGLSLSSLASRRDEDHFLDAPQLNGIVFLDSVRRVECGHTDVRHWRIASFHQPTTTQLVSSYNKQLHPSISLSDFKILLCILDFIENQFWMTLLFTFFYNKHVKFKDS